MKKVLIPTKLDTVAAKILTDNGKYIVIQDTETSMNDLLTANPDTHALIVRSEKVTQQVIDALPKLKVIIRAGAGFNTIDTKYARSRGIDVMNTPGANSNAVAEEAIAMMLADARHIIAADASCRAGKWEKKNFMGTELTGKTLGVVGMGNIGQTLIKRLEGFDLTFYGYDPAISAERARDINVKLTNLKDIFAKCDYITLHIPENDETRKLISTQFLSLMKDGATIVNCARAGIIDEDALREIRKTKNIRFLNDVYPKDAAGDKSVSDIADIMLPHLGASSKEANFNAAKRSAEELIELDEKGITAFIVNRDIPAGLDEAYCTLANTITKLCRCILGKKAQPKVIETSCYGSLQEYKEWLMVPIVAAVNDGFESSIDHKSAQAYLDEMGIDYVNRDIDQAKGFENSITVDMTSSGAFGSLSNVSIRGTVAENQIMISRINEFDKLWFEPSGNSVIFLYEDRPGVLGTIGIRLAETGVNIEDVRNPHNPETNHSLAIMKTNNPVDEALLNKIGDEISALASFSIKI